MSTQDTVQSRFLDLVGDKLDAKNDAHLARILDSAPPVISKLRRETLPLGPTLLIRIHEVTDIPMRELKSMLGLRSLPSARQVAQ
jgi:hypothetical protein